MVDFVRYPHAALSFRAEPAPLDAELLAIGAKLLAAQIEAQAYGLAAAHIGINAPVIVLNRAVEPDARDDALYFNPVVLAVAEHTQAGAEASVSLPGIDVQIVRPIWTEIAYDDVDGARQSVRLEGFAARCALHEIDQMNGMFFLDRLSRLKRDMALKKFYKVNRA